MLLHKKKIVLATKDTVMRMMSQLPKLSRLRKRKRKHQNKNQRKN